MIESRQFRIPQRARTEALWIAVGLLGSAVLTILYILYFDDILLVPRLILSSATILYFIFAYTQLSFRRNIDSYTIWIDDGGITALSSQQPSVHLSWPEIVRVKRRFFFWFLYGLELSNESKNRRILLHTSLEDWSQLLSFLLERAGFFQLPPKLPVAFRRKSIRALTLSLALPLLIAAPYGLSPSDEHFVLELLIRVLFCSMGSLLLLGGIFNGPRRLTVDTQTFSFAKGFRKKSLDFHTVADISCASATRKNPLATVNVKVTLKDGRKDLFCPFGSDPFAVYRALMTGWQYTQEHSSETP